MLVTDDATRATYVGGVTSALLGRRECRGGGGTTLDAGHPSPRALAVGGRAAPRSATDA